jgi:predicted CoA-binding protein
MTSDPLVAPLPNPSPEEIRQLLTAIRTIAVVGISDKPDRPSYRVARYLQTAGYTIFPVNPRLATWEGIPCYPSLLAIPEPIDLVDLFRRAEEVPPVVDEALAKGCRAFWLQLGIRNDAAVEPLRARGVIVVQDLCLKVEHQRLLTP